MAPPTSTETLTGSTPAPQLSTLTLSNGIETAGDLIHKYVFYQNKPEAFDVQDPKKQREGPSPYAATPNEGPSVLKSYTPQRASGKLDSKYKFIEVTPPIGRQYLDLKLTDILEDDELLRDLAITISERGAVFFRDQKDLTTAQQKELILKLTKFAGRPDTSGLHIHPTALAGGLLKDDGLIDPEVTLLNSRLRKELYKNEGEKGSKGSDTVFHSDVTFEPVPASFSSLKMIETPSATGPSDEELARLGGGAVGGSGGDTIWASGYALAEKISPSFLAYLETLTGEFYQPLFKSATDSQHIPFYSAPRGAPENVGTVTTATHPLVRTNPVTGWKSVFAIGSHFYKVNGVTEDESNLIKQYLSDLLYRSPEIQLRFKWNAGDLGIWDNRSTYHSAILDIVTHDGKIENRTGIRALASGERPFFDPKSKLRSEALRERAASE